jgi:2-polyprenyl-6-methoxyphenol hydroxylase-like FAD-dependent oxidoreductase
VGGGISGLALARSLEVEGIPYRLVERHPTAADGGLAINLPGNAIRALTLLGLHEQIEELGHPLRRREYRTAGDRLLFAVDEDEFWGPALRPRSITRSSLIGLLREGLDKDAIRYSAEVQAIADDATTPELVFRDNTRLGASVIVGADGVRSVVRRETFGNGSERGHGMLAEASWRFMVSNADITCWTVWADAEGMVLLMPTGDGLVYGWAAITSPQKYGRSPEDLAEMVSKFPKHVREIVARATSDQATLHHSPLEEVRLERWHRNRVVLIGDAAHATTPVWAQGAALGMEDAIALGRTLAKGKPIPPALGTFARSRRARVAHVQAMTDAMSRAAKLPPFVRNMLLPLVGPRRYRQTYGPLKAPF